MVYNLAAMGKDDEGLKQGKLKDFADRIDFFAVPPRLDVESLATAVLLFISLAASVAYLRLGLARTFYPYALDLVEEAMVMQAWRLAQDLPVFVPPNAEFVPQVYMPLFTWLGGLLMRLTGFGFWPLRLISFLSTLGTAVLIFYVGWRESRVKTAAFAGSALFWAGYRLVGGWFDLARVDALFAFLSLLGLVVLVYGRRGKQSNAEKAQRGTEVWIVLGAVLLGLAFLTKQNGLLLAVVALVYFITAESAERTEKNKKSASSALIRALFLVFIPFVIVALVPILVLENLSGGWFSYYVVTIAYASPLDFGRLRNIFVWELGAGMGVLVGLWLLLSFRPTFVFFKRLSIGDWKEKISSLQALITTSPWLLFVGTAVFISVAGRSTVGGNLNNMLIGYAFLCLVPALSWGHLSKDSQIKQIEKQFVRSGKSVYKEMWPVLWSLLIVVQFGLVTFPLNGALPQQYGPTAEMRAAGDVLLAHVEQEPGEIWLLLHPSYAVRAGKRPYVHLQTLWHARKRGGDPLPADLVSLIEQQHFAQIISDESDFFETEPAFLELLLVHYEAAETLTLEQSPPTLSGPMVRPITVYVPRGAD